MTIFERGTDMSYTQTVTFTKAIFIRGKLMEKEVTPGQTMNHT